MGNIIIVDIKLCKNYIYIRAIYNNKILGTNYEFYIQDEKGQQYIFDSTKIYNDGYVKKEKLLENECISLKIQIPYIIGIYKIYLKCQQGITLLAFKHFHKGEFEDYVLPNEPYMLRAQNNIIKITHNCLEIMIKSKKIIDEYENSRRKYFASIGINTSIRDLIENTSKKKIILFNDRPQIAADNALALFEYICINKKELSKDCYFVVSKDTASYEKVSKIGNVIEYGSNLHKKMFLNSDVIVSSHLNFYNPLSQEEMLVCKDALKYKLLFVQHGIVINDVHRYLCKGKSQASLVVTSLKKEKKELLLDKYQYDESEIILTGMPRFDKLVDTSNANNKKMIFISPTWRSYLTEAINKNGVDIAKDGFEKSEYFLKWSSLLTNDELLTTLRKNNYYITFLLHPSADIYSSFFTDLQNDVVDVIRAEEVEYSKMFNELSLLITDYSSIIFDVAYLQKPMIYYQFDKEDYFSKHYKPGYFSYANNGFGETFFTEDEVVKKVLWYINHSCVLEKKWVKNIATTFEYTDKSNCERVYENLKQLLIN